MIVMLALLATIGVQEPSCKVTALLERDTAQAGKPIEIAVQFELEPGWHIYWKNPGDSGEATTVKWQLPAGWQDIDLRFPTPHAIDAGGIINYGYEDRVTLKARIKPPSTYKGEAVTITGEASYLICKEACVPGSRKFSFSLPATAASATTWKEIERAFPVNFLWEISSTLTAENLTISFAGANVSRAYFFAESESVVDHSAAQQLKSSAGGYELTIPVSPYAKSRPKVVKGILVLIKDDASVCGYQVELTP